MRRTITALLAFGALAAPAMAADTVSIAPIQFGPELTEKAEEYGQRELDYLAEQLREDLERELREQRDRLHREVGPQRHVAAPRAGQVLACAEINQ